MVETQVFEFYLMPEASPDSPKNWPFKYRDAVTGEIYHVVAVGTHTLGSNALSYQRIDFHYPNHPSANQLHVKEMVINGHRDGVVKLLVDANGIRWDTPDGWSRPQENREKDAKEALF